jgi:hypothetical protein
MTALSGCLLKNGRKSWGLKMKRKNMIGKRTTVKKNGRKIKWLIQV